MASYGYVVVLPQHPGSDTQQTEDFLAGFSRQIFRLNEFIDRPLDITFVLNELTRLNNQQFGGKLNLESVGVGGILLEVIRLWLWRGQKSIFNN